MKTIIALALALYTMPALASQIIDVQGASNAIIDSQNKQTTIYYSNITDKLDITTLYNIGDPKGATCSPIMNANCKIVSDNLTITAVADGVASKKAELHLIYSNLRPSAGTPLSSLVHVAAARPLGRNQPVNFPTSWGSLCSVVAHSKIPVSGLGAHCEDKEILLGSHNLFLYLVADYDGSGEVGSDITLINVVFTSSIPRSAGGGLGLYDFKVAADKGAINLTDVKADFSFPGMTNEIGIQSNDVTRDREP